ncbi:MAG: germination protein YpeB [Ruminococcaceae bacterium]|nr:germination protein YpeB [Oscillospiraceae bacterium]
MGAKKRQNKRVLFFMVTALIIFSAFGLYHFKRAEDLRLAVDNQYAHAFHELTEYVNDIDVLLKKTMLVQNARQMSSLSAEIYMQSAAAKANLAVLPTGGTNLSDTSKFLSQTADYTGYLATKVINNGTVSAEEYENLVSLSDYAGRVKKHLTEMDDRLYNQQLSFDRVSDFAVHADDGNSDFADSMETMEKTFQDYPSLIYDGPFSEHIEAIQSSVLSGKLNISQMVATDKAKLFLGDGRSENIKFSGEGNGKIPTFDFIGTEKDGRSYAVSVSKKGGEIVYMLDNRQVSESKLTIEEAVENAKKFLEKKGFQHMKSSYYETAGHTVTVNFAAMQNETVLYSDLIKVKVALDNGEVLGFEAMGYLMNHKTRIFPEKLLSEEEVKERISPHLSLESMRLAFIPLESKREVLTFECKGNFNDETFLLYINAVTGDEEKILMLIESENGKLTV